MKKRWIGRLRAHELTVRLLQCDLAGHSSWFSACTKNGYGIAATNARATLGERIDRALLPLGFERVFWRGDGGLYAARQMAGGDTVVRAARILRGTFSAWQDQRKHENLKLQELRIRICCHSCAVWGGSRTEYWSSDDLNLFCKYERAISHESCIAITRPIFENLESFRDDFDPEWSKSISVGDQRWTIYYDSTSSPEQSVKSTVDWFRSQFGVQIDGNINAPSQRFTLGDAAVLYLCQSPEDSLDIILRQVGGDFGAFERDPRWVPHKQLITSEIGQEKDSRKQVDRIKAAPIDVRLALKDFPLARIDYVPLRYSDGRSFLRWVSLDPEFRESLNSNRVDFEDAPRRPGLLVTHNVLTIKDGGERFVLLCQRSARQKEVGIHLGKWSASMEEQFEQGDITFEETIRRGLREELLAGEAEKATISIIGLFLERSILNLAAASVCTVPFTFSEVHNLWNTCVDRDEHTQVIALPIHDREIITECIRQGILTAEARRIAKIQPGREIDWKNTREFELHPSSAFRLALALWQAER
jgi:hypothetical protein